MSPTASRPGGGDAGPVDFATLWESDAHNCTCRMCRQPVVELRPRVVRTSPVLQYLAGRANVLGGPRERVA